MMQCATKTRSRPENSDVNLCLFSVNFFLNRLFVRIFAFVYKMAFGLYSLLESILLLVNAVCILHEERFLKKSISITKFCRNSAKYKILVLSPSDIATPCLFSTAFQAVMVSKPVMVTTHGF